MGKVNKIQIDTHNLKKNENLKSEKFKRMCKARKNDFNRMA